MGRDDRIGPIERREGREPADAGPRVEERTRAPVQREMPTGREPARRDQFRHSGLLERFIRAIASKLEQATQHTFRLPGSGRTVQDRRGERARRGSDRGQAEAPADAARAPTRGEGRSGRAESAQQAAPEAGGSAHSATGPASSGGELKTRDVGTVSELPQPGGAESPSGGRELSKFEAKIVERFEQGAKLVKEAPDQPPTFLQKTAAQWKTFFRQFLPRTEKKQVSMESVASDAMVFRGLVGKSGSEGKGVMIGDLALQTGQIEKFARFDVELAHVMGFVRGLQPGASLPRQVIAAGVQQELLEYFAIGHARAEAEIFATRDSAGIFTSLKTEEAVAQRLGLPLGQGVPTAEARAAEARESERARVGGAAGRWRGLLSDEEAVGDELPSRFVPWWKWDREERLGARRWFTVVSLVTTVVVIGVLTWLLFHGL
ncbi:MAG: hypothetical protein HY696_02940 [Deltaproteobacteria bacterium]|nr:hypothetical protein [Deltaproteobacteria bacterium]